MSHNKIRYILDTNFVDFGENTNINVRAFFLMLVPDRLKDAVIIKKDRYKYKLIHPGIENLIYSVRHSGFCKGIVMKKKSGDLKNSVSLYITTKKKSIHIKVLCSKLGISGDDKKETIHHVTQQIKLKINAMETMLTRIKKYDPAKKTLQWVLQQVRSIPVKIIYNTFFIVDDEDTILKIDQPGYYCYKDSKLHRVEFFYEINRKLLYLLKYSYLGLIKSLHYYKKNKIFVISEHGTPLDLGNDDVLKIDQPGEYLIDTEGDKIKSIYEVQNNNYLQIPSEYKTKIYPADVDPIIADYLLSHLFDYRDYKTYSYFMQSIYEIDQICEGSLDHYQVQQSMIFTNFKLDFEIDLKKLYINGDKNGFLVVQDDDNSKLIKIQSLCHIPEDLKNEVKTNDRTPNVHTFSVYNNGRVSQTSPHWKLSQSEHDRFIKYIHKLKPLIEKNNTVSSY